MNNALIYIISPTHVINALAALEKYNKLLNEDFKATVIVHWPGINLDILNEIRDIVVVMLKENKYIDNIISFTTIEKDIFMQKKYSDLMLSVKNKIGRDEINNIFYPHDIDGGMYQLICTVYPTAKRICFGDALGNVYEKHVHLSFLNNKTDDNKVDIKYLDNIKKNYRSVKNKISSLIVKYKSAYKKKSDFILFNDFKPDEVILILPVDQSGNFIKNIPLTIPDKSIVLDVLNKSIKNATDLHNYISFILMKYKNIQKWILLTDNFAEGNFINFDLEIDMWISIIKENVMPGSLILLKSHPGETLERNIEIINKIGNEYLIIELDHLFKRYPIEMWYELLINSKIICMSYPVLSLKYLYDINVIQPMDNQFIQKWFPSWTWDSYRNSLSLYMEPLKKLSKWDGKSILYSGSYNQEYFVNKYFKNRILKYINSLGNTIIKIPAQEKIETLSDKDFNLYHNNYCTQSIENKMFFKIGAGTLRYKYWKNIDLVIEWYKELLYIEAVK